MPVSFLSQAQRQSYGRYINEPSFEQLAGYFYLDEFDRQEIAKRRQDHTRLGFALQLTTVRFLGTFLENPVDVPENVITYLSKQLNIQDTTGLAQYPGSDAEWEHAKSIREVYGYAVFHDAQPVNLSFLRWLYTRTWLSDERPSVLFDLATAWLVEHKVLLPGATVLERLVAQTRDRVNQRLWRQLAALPTEAQRQQLLDLLVIPEGEQLTRFEQLRRAPSRISSPEVTRALQRLETVRSLNVGKIDLSQVPASRIKTLARHAAKIDAYAISRMSDDRQIATLLAFAHTLEALAQDDALDVLDQRVSELWAKAVIKGKQTRLNTLAELDAASRRLKEVSEIVLDPTCPDHLVRLAVFARMTPEQLTQAIELVGDVTRPPDPHYYEYLIDDYRSIRRFVPTLLRTVSFQAMPAGQPVLDALAFLHRCEGTKKQERVELLLEAPVDVVSYTWRSHVFAPESRINFPYYTFCVLHQLQEGLRRRDIFVSPSYRWNDPRTKLLSKHAWQKARAKVCLSLGHSEAASDALDALAKQLDDAYKRTAGNLPFNSQVRIEREDGRDKLVVSHLDKLDTPESLVQLRQQVKDLLPHASLPDVMLEINALTGFADEFEPIDNTTPRTDDLLVSICAVLMAEACNIGLEALVDPSVSALQRDRLLWVQQHYIRAETLARANARLVDAQTQISLAQTWGGGDVASADGLRFVVPVRTLNAGPNRKYFGSGRGVTFLNFCSDQFTGFHGIVIPGTPRDALYILDGLLEQETSLRPMELMTDTAGYTDVIFGLFWLLGFQFSPRLADLGSTRFWRIDRDADYGALDGIARHKIRTNLITDNWDDLLRVAGSLKMGTVSASDFMRTLHSGRRASTLSKAIGELGRIVKTLYLLHYIDDETYRRRILTQLNRSETRHQLARAVFFGQRGELRQRYREGQEDQLGALGLVVNILVLWNTRYMNAALDHLRSIGVEVRPEDILRLSPLGFKHFNFLGQYDFSLAEPLQRGAMRPLRISTLR